MTAYELRISDWSSDVCSSDLTASTGVGLANIRGRLRQAYGENHRFETRSTPGGGFTVLIEIPFEIAKGNAENQAGTAATQTTFPARVRSADRQSGVQGKVGSESVET